MAFIARKFILRSTFRAALPNLSFKSLFFGGLTVITPLSFIGCESNTLCDNPKNKFGRLDKVHTFAHMSDKQHSEGLARGVMGIIVCFLVVIIVAVVMYKINK